MAGIAEASFESRTQPRTVAELLDVRHDMIVEALVGYDTHMEHIALSHQQELGALDAQRGAGGFDEVASHAADAYRAHTAEAATTILEAFAQHVAAVEPLLSAQDRGYLQTALQMAERGYSTSAILRQTAARASSSETADGIRSALDAGLAARMKTMMDKGYLPPHIRSETILTASTPSAQKALSVLMDAFTPAYADDMLKKRYLAAHVKSTILSAASSTATEHALAAVLDGYVLDNARWHNSEGYLPHMADRETDSASSTLAQLLMRRELARPKQSAEESAVPSAKEGKEKLTRAEEAFVDQMIGIVLRRGDSFKWIAGEDKNAVLDAIRTVQKMRATTPGITDEAIWRQLRLAVELGQTNDNIDKADPRDLKRYQIIDAMQAGKRTNKLPF